MGFGLVSACWQVWGEDNSLYWRRANKISDMPRVVTRRNIFSLGGKLVGHLPIGGWLRVAVAFIKRRASDVTAGWDDKIDDAPLNTMIKEVLTRVRKEDPAQGRWYVNGQTLSVWVDASSLATSMSLVYNGAVVDDACWLRPAKDSQNINLTELDAIIKGINLAILWTLYFVKQIAPGVSKAAVKTVIRECEELVDRSSKCTGQRGL